MWILPRVDFINIRQATKYIQIHNILQYVPSRDTNTVLYLLFFMIQLALALKTRLCVYMYLPYMYVYKTTNVHTVVFMENWNLWDCVISTMISEGKRITCHKFFNWGKVNTTVYEGHISCVYTNTHIYTDSYINTCIPIIWNIHILTHLLWPLYLTILHTLHPGSSLFLLWLRQLVTVFFKLKWYFKKGSDSIPTKWHFRIPLLVAIV